MKSFVPLESSPEVFNRFLQIIGIHRLEFTDVYGLDSDLLSFIPRPVRAVVLVFPVSNAYEEYRKKQDSKPHPHSSAVWAQQTIVNSCGTMAILHALANGVSSSTLGGGSGFNLIEHFRTLPASERPKYLENSVELESAHDQVANLGYTAAPNAEELSENHYVCLTKSGNELVELDGRRTGPIVRAANVSEEDVMAIPQTIEVIREFLDRESGSTSFAMLALVNKH